MTRDQAGGILEVMGAFGVKAQFICPYGIFEGDGYSKAFIDYRMCELKSCE